MNPIIEKPSASYLASREVNRWPVWEKEPSRFSYKYDETEECYFLEGEVVIETATSSVRILPGDFVTFPSGLSCTWDIIKTVRKRYNFI